MNILIATRVFYPSIGGLEAVTLQLAEKWQEKGHKVKIVTQTRLGTSNELKEFTIIREPSFKEWLQATKDIDLFVQSGISLKSLPFGFLRMIPVVVIHHNMLPLSLDSIGLRMHVKRWVTHLVYNIAVSESVTNDIPSRKKEIIYNPFNPSLANKSTPESKYNLLFVGRLVSVKGCDLALKALAMLPSKYNLTICGDGPEKENLIEMTYELNIRDRVEFLGWVDHSLLKMAAKKASIQVVPSRYEPFGIVALEAIAANCAVVATNTGGLPEAVGACGILVPKDDPASLADGIELAVVRKEQLMNKRASHLQNFEVEKISQDYLNVFSKLVAS